MGSPHTENTGKDDVVVAGAHKNIDIYLGSFFREGPAGLHHRRSPGNDLWKHRVAHTQGNQEKQGHDVQTQRHAEQMLTHRDRGVQGNTRRSSRSGNVHRPHGVASGQSTDKIKVSSTGRRAGETDFQSLKHNSEQARG